MSIDSHTGLSGDTLSCGHVASPRGVPFVLGTRRGPDATVCWACDEERQVAELRTAAEVTAYFDEGGRTITTWTGAKLAEVTWLTRTERYTPTGGFDGSTSFLAVDVHGQRWQGSSPGRGLCVRMQRS
ncbi:MAG: hypothetical protein QOG64_1827 [Acidimicrobiaceae bacterium]|jgi:hypothetical protein|nr:hypothetical protein [Acidimicrobiaceae bacterium]